MTLHRAVTATDGHVVHSLVYASAAARTAAVLAPEDVGRIAKQTDNATFWLLSASPGTWVQVGGGAGAVVSVFGRTGAVVAASGDYTAGQVGADAAGTSAAGIAAHVAAGDPHPQYLTPAEGSAAYEALGAVSSGIAAHVAAGDPHPQYFLESNTISDAQHGSRGGGALHALATNLVAGFMSAVQFVKLSLSIGATSADLTIYVGPSGSDTTGDGSAGLPYRQVAFALSTVPKYVRHLVRVIVSAGAYNPFLITGFTFDPSVGSAACGIHVYCDEWQNATVATGSATGTLTAVSAGSLSVPIAFSTVTDGGNALTNNDVQHKHFRFVTGTSATQVIPIEGNTAGVISLQSCSAVGGAGGTYAIVEPGAVVSATTQIAPPIPTVGGTLATPIQAALGIFGNNTLGLGGTFGTPHCNVRVEGFKFAPTASVSGYRVVFLADKSAIVNRCVIDGAAASAGSRVDVYLSGGRTQLVNCVVKTNASGVAIAPSGDGKFECLNTAVTSAGTGLTGVSIGAAGGGANLRIDLRESRIEKHSFGIQTTNPALLTTSGVRIKSGGSQCIRFRLLDGLVGNIFLNLLGLDLVDASASSALELSGPMFVNANSVSGSNNLIGWNLGQSTKVKISSASTLTGTTEISLDSVTHTLAEMRAASPKLISNAYGSAVWE